MISKFKKITCRLAMLCSVALMPSLTSCANSITISSDVKCYIGSGEPTRTDVKEGDIYLDNLSLTVYQYSDNTWNNLGGINVDTSGVTRSSDKQITDIACENLYGDNGLHYIKLNLTYSDGTSEEKLVRNEGADTKQYELLDPMYYEIPICTVYPDYFHETIDNLKLPIKRVIDHSYEEIIYLGINSDEERLVSNSIIDLSTEGTYSLRYLIDGEFIDLQVSVKDCYSFYRYGARKKLSRNAYPINSERENFIVEHIIFSNDGNSDGNRVYYTSIDDYDYERFIIPYINERGTFKYGDQDLKYMILKKI